MADRCTSRKKSGEPCKGWRTPGSDKCRRHLFNPQARAKAAVRAEVINWGFDEAVHDPAEVLLKLISISYRQVERYAEEMAELTANSETLQAALIRESYGEFGVQSEFVRGIVALYNEERDRAAGLSKSAIAAGLMRRQVELAERQGSLLADVLRAVLADPSLGLTAEQRAAAPAAIRRHLQIVS